MSGTLVGSLSEAALRWVSLREGARRHHYQVDSALRGSNSQVVDGRYAGTISYGSYLSLVGGVGELSGSGRGGKRESNRSG